MYAMGSRNTRNREMGERIRALRGDRTLVSLSKAVGYPYSWQLSKVELDGVMPDGDRLDKIAEELNTTTAYLLTGDESKRYPSGGRAEAPHFEEWLAALPEGTPQLALDMARTAWTLAHGEQQIKVPRPAQTPTLTPPSRSASQSLVPPSESGMRSKRSATRKSVAPPAVVRRKVR